MAATEWVVIRKLWCERAHREAQLLEQRVYPAEILPETVGYRVLAHKCESAIECNLREFPCRWAYTRPEHDPFALT